jgi:hypothetical protein
MLRPLLFAAASALILSACASAPGASTSTESGATETAAKTSPFNLAIDTANELVKSGNTPTAIQRLMQLVGDTSLTPDQRAQTLYLLGDLSQSATGYNAEGGVAYLKEVIADFAATASAGKAKAKLPAAEAKVAVMLATLGSVDSTRSEQFLALMNLGRHQDAIDIMVANDLTPDNEELLAMQQIGYLCDDTNLTGRAYKVTDRDGTVRNLRFCDLGK